MKTFCLSLVLITVLVSIPTIGQVPGQETPNKAHETVIDGKWEAKVAAQDKPVAMFDFKNENGVVTGTVTQDGLATEIKNGTLEGLKLKFETRHTGVGGAKPMTMAWTGTITNEGDVHIINLTAAMQTEDGGPAVGDLQARQMEARRVKQ